jgi:lysophospholipase L1-like esterase
MNLWQSITATFEMIVSGFRAANGDPDAWEPAIHRFEAQDRIQPPPADAIVFTGSSSFTLWSTMTQDMAPLPVLNRGFGGARIQDVVHYATRCVLPYHPRAVVLFAGTNDIAEPRPATAQQVFEGYRDFVEAVHAALPVVPIYYVSITPTPLRWKLWPVADEANHLIEAFAPAATRACTSSTSAARVARPGRQAGASSLYRFDRLHPNKKGYAVWTAVIKPRPAGRSVPWRALNPYDCVYNILVGQYPFAEAE